MKRSSPSATTTRRPNSRPKNATAPVEVNGRMLRPVRSSPWVLAGESAIHGRGLYARCDIPDGTKVIEYVGEKITKAEAWRREERRRDAEQRGADAGVWIFELNARHDIDGRSPQNTARLMNHSCQPNCKAEIIRGRIWLVAKRDIAAGEELRLPRIRGQRHPR